MFLIDETFVLDRHGQKADDVPSGLVSSHLFDGEDSLISSTSQAAYDQALTIAAKAEGDRTAAETRQLEAFKRAAAEFVFMHIIPKLNVRISSEGVVTSATSKQFGDANFTIASPEEIEKIQDQYEKRALDLVRKWRPRVGGVLPGVANG